MSETQGLSSCCLSGHVHEGTPKHNFSSLYGLNTYVTGGDASSTIVVITDIFGPKLPNVQLLADELAEQTGFRCLVPDFADDDWIDTALLKNIAPLKSDPEPGMAEKVAGTAKVGASLGPWLVRHREGVTKPIIDKYIAELRADSAVKKIGVIGHCWGARYAILLGHGDATQPVDVVVGQHPSFVAVPGEIEKVAKPIQINVGDVDAMMPIGQVKQAKEVLSKVSFPAEVNIISDAVHGFAVRGDQNNDDERKQKEEAVSNAVRWFKEYLK